MALRVRRSTSRPHRGRPLFVTGGSGFLGSHVVTGPEAVRWTIVAPPSNSLDLRKAESVRETILDWKPSAIIHTAYRRAERRSIVDASRNVAEAAARVGARLVHVSTDVVFAGRDEPYGERDAPSPIHDYGRDKLDAENRVLAACPGAVVVRISLLCGRSRIGHHEAAVRDAITGRAPSTFYTDEIRSPALVDDVAATLTLLARQPEITGVLHLGGPEPTSRAQLALDTAIHYGWDAAALTFGTTVDAGLVRPRHVVLDSRLAASYGHAVRAPYSW